MMNDVGNKRDIKQTNLVRDLGITVDNNLNWNEHVHRMVGKVNRILSMLKERLSVGTLSCGKTYMYLE